MQAAPSRALRLCAGSGWAQSQPCPARLPGGDPGTRRGQCPGGSVVTNWPPGQGQQDSLPHAWDARGPWGSDARTVRGWGAAGAFIS